MATTAAEFGHAPIDGCIDLYYDIGTSGNDRARIVALKKVMKSALSITKSRTGETVLKTNRIERQELQKRIGRLWTDHHCNAAANNRDKIVFKARYAKWLHKDAGMPDRIRKLRQRYKLIRNEIQSRKRERTLSSLNPLRSAACRLLSTTKSLPENEIIELTSQQLVAKDTDAVRGQISSNNNTTSMAPRSTTTIGTFQRPVLSGGRQLASREMRRRQTIGMWRERTFDMDSIRELLVEQSLHQQSMYCKLAVSKYREEKLRKESTCQDRFKLSIGRQSSASTISELTDSRPPTTSTKLPPLLGTRHVLPPIHRHNSLLYKEGKAKRGQSKKTFPLHVSSRLSNKRTTLPSVTGQQSLVGAIQEMNVGHKQVTFST